MRFSSLTRIAAVLAMAGCAHGTPPPPSPAPPPSAAVTPAPAADAAVAVPGATRPADPRLDPSEEITPQELASIPDPVPGASSAAPREPAPSPPIPAEAPSAVAPSVTSAGTSAATASPVGPEPAAPGAAWRVQIFASPDLAVADSVAKSASASLEAPYAIEFEGGLYKVRLGSFGSEQEAQPLRDRALRSGFPGAFRVRSVTR